MPEKGTVVMSRYELGRSLGHGTFSKVYHARSLVSGEIVAVKVIDKEKALRAGAGMVDQIEREVAVMRLVGRHPNVVHLHEVMASRSKIYFVMELVRGGELLGRLFAGGRLGEDTARRYFHQLVAAVDFCHSRGVYHRDLKPENLLVDDDGGGNLKVTDFGLSALSASRRRDGLLHTTCGTPSYVAPEIIGDKGYDGATADVWSCGVILFLLLAGYLPFFDSNLMEMYKKITNGEFKIPDWFTPDARSLISRLLDPNPKTRITIDELVNHPWFKKGYTKPASSNTIKLNEEEKSANAMNMKPACLNAFDIISLSHGFDLSGMFFHGHSHRTQELFVTGKPAAAIVSRLEEIAETENFTVEKKKKKKKKKEQEEDGMTVKLQGWKEGRKGQLAIDAEIFEVSPSCYVVEVKKTAGDTLEYQAFCNRDLRPSLNDICWTSPAPAATASSENQQPAVSELSPLSSPRNR
uniref:non-specific serine/threonine protein kinase n=1 Tax=Oryza punctata TaxID=4537 RepID=A0A0E0KZP8_ORYPU